MEDSFVNSKLTTFFNSMDGWGVFTCEFLVMPVVFEHGPDHYYVVWETRCASETPTLEWWANDTPVGGANTSLHVVNAQYRMIDKSHHRYSAIIGPVGLATKVNYRSFVQNLSTGNYTITRRNETELTQVLVMADNQSESDEFRQVLTAIQGHYGKNNVPDAILHAGDMVQTVDELNNWNSYLFTPMEDN
ncbi:hypothetical protein IWW38_004801, partial [Coemansia aciculifera]